MKTSFALIAALLSVSLVVVAPAGAASDQSTQKSAHAKRAKRAHASGYVYRWDPHFIGDLSGNCRLQRDAGVCMMDLGYGRCEPCSVGGGPR